MSDQGLTIEIKCLTLEQADDVKQALELLREGEYPHWGTGSNLRVVELAGTEIKQR